MLEGDFRAELHEATRSSAGDSSEVTRITASNRLPKLGMVKEVESFDSHLERRTLGNLGVFLHRKIKVVDSRPMQRIAARVSILATDTRISGETTSERTIRNPFKAAGLQPAIMLTRR